MNRLSLLLLILSLSGKTCYGQVARPAAPDQLQTGTYQLVWADEFATDGPPDPRKWTFENGFVRNNELQWYQPENARCAGGFLVIEGRREEKPNPTYVPGSTAWNTSRPRINYTATSLITRGLHSWQYGRMEMRGRIDTQPGIWPAFWTLGVAGEWPANGEIDIMEYYRGMLLANVAWGTNRALKPEWRTTEKQISTFKDPDWSTKFHV